MSIRRVFYLLKRDFILYRKPILYLYLVLALITGIIMFISTEEYCNENQIDITIIIELFVILPAWFLISAGAFHEFRRDGTRSSYLLLPATTLEKWVVRWFECSIIFLFFAFITTILSYIVFGHLINQIWRECQFVSWTAILKFEFSKSLSITIQSLLFLFGIVFNRYGVAKSIFATSITVAFGFFFIGLLPSLLGIDKSTYELPQNWDSFRIFAVMFVLTILLASFYKLKEKEA